MCMYVCVCMCMYVYVCMYQCNEAVMMLWNDHRPCKICMQNDNHGEWYLWCFRHWHVGYLYGFPHVCCSKRKAWSVAPMVFPTLKMLQVDGLEGTQFGSLHHCELGACCLLYQQRQQRSFLLCVLYAFRC
jgi:hypothetical protein